MDKTQQAIALNRCIALIQWIRSIDCDGAGIDLGETMNREAAEACEMGRVALAQQEVK